MANKNINQFPEAEYSTNPSLFTLLAWVESAPVNTRTQKVRASVLIDKAILATIARLGLTTTGTSVSLASNATPLFPILNFGSGLAFNPTTKALSSTGGSGAIYDAARLGVIIDGTTDSTSTLQTALNTVATAGGGILYVSSSTNQFMVIDGTVEVPSNVELNFKVPLKYGSKGRIRIFGDIASTPTTNQPRIRQSCLAGTTTLYLALTSESVASFFAVGDQIIIRGDNNASGVSLTNEINYVTAVDTVNNNLELANPLEDTYEPIYTTSGFAATGNIDRTSILKVSSRLLATNPTAGTNTITISGTSSIFAVGDYITLSDRETGANTAGTSKNILRQEMSRIIAISGSTITLQNNLYHAYNTTYKAQIAKVLPTFNAKIVGARIDYHTQSISTNYHGLQIQYGVNCSIENCSVENSLGHGLRISNGINCTIEKCFVRPNSVDVSSGQAYGITLYGSTHCKIKDCYVERSRHAILLFTGAAGNEISGCVSVDCRVADFDCHGANEIKNHFHHNLCIAGSSISPDSSFKTAYKVGNPTHVFGSHDNLYENNIAYNFVGGCGAQIIPSSTGNIFRNNTFNSCTYGFQIQQNGSFPTLIAKNNLIDNNEVISCTGFCNISGSTNKVVQNLTIRNNKSIQNSNHFTLSNTTGYLLLESNSVINPILDTPTSYGINLSGCVNAKVLNNKVNETFDGIRVVGSPSAQVIGNVLTNVSSGNARIDISSSNDVVALNNIISGTVNAAYSSVSGSTGVLLDGIYQCNGKQAYVKGSSFEITSTTAPTTRPGSVALIDGDRWKNPSDRRWYFWHGTGLAWVSEEIFNISAPYTNLSASTNGVQRSIEQGVNLWIERIEANGSVVSPNDSTASYWQFRVTTQDSTATDTTITGSTINTSTFGVNTNVRIAADVNFYLVVTSAMINLRLIAGKAGTTATPGTLTGSAVVYYRRAIR